MILLHILLFWLLLFDSVCCCSLRFLRQQQAMEPKSRTHTHTPITHSFTRSSFRCKMPYVFSIFRCAQPYFSRTGKFIGCYTHIKSIPLKLRFTKRPTHRPTKQTKNAQMQKQRAQFSAIACLMFDNQRRTRVAVNFMFQHRQKSFLSFFLVFLNDRVGPIQLMTSSTR